MNGSKRALARRLLDWYRRRRRNLPWRVPPGAAPGARPDPYHVLVSETMLQQTQVATVIPYFNRFIQRFPTIRDLGDADEQEVLGLWQGLGYYARARNLRAAAQVVMRDFGGILPRDAKSLIRLPGVGRYTAGAIASLAFDQRTPIVDGNVARVLCRIDLIRSDPRQPTTREALWRRADQLVSKGSPGDFNSALMELGATICTPRAPKCLGCPVRSHCEAQAAGMQEKVPPPRQATPKPLVRRRTICIRRINGTGEEWLLEQRPATGRWAGLWQFITRPAGGRGRSVPTTRLHKLGTVTHGLSHRRYHFDVYIGDARDEGSLPVRVAADGRPVRWVRLSDLAALPLSRPQLTIAEMLRTFSFH